MPIGILEGTNNWINERQFIVENFLTISLQCIGKQFDERNASSPILDGITYTFDRNHSYALMGASGIGKSTLMQLLAGLDNPTSGSVFYNGAEVSSISRAERHVLLQKEIGLLFQTPCLIDDLSVIENVMIKGLIGKESYRISQDRAQDLLEQVGLVDKAQQAPPQLSGGEQQRVALARALFNQPSFMLADEPTAHLDEMTKKMVTELLIRCHHQWGMGLIIATHDESVAQRMDVVLCLEGGKLKELAADAQEPQQNGLPSQVFLGH